MGHLPSHTFSCRSYTRAGKSGCCAFTSGIVQQHPDIIFVGQPLPGYAKLFDELRIQQCFATVEEAVSHYDHLSPHIVLFSMGECQFGVGNCVKIMKGYYPFSRIILLDEALDEKSMVSAILAGANGYLVTSDTQEDIVRAVWKVHQGECAISGSASAALFSVVKNRQTQLPEANVSARETQAKNEKPALVEGDLLSSLSHRFRYS